MEIDASTSIKYPEPYIKFIELFNRQEFFKSHEALEKLWMKTGGEKKLFYQALIQAAVALHHYSNKNQRGALYECHIAVRKLKRVPKKYLGINVKKLIKELADCIKRPQASVPRRDRRLPILKFEPQDRSQAR